jgi:ribosomal protein L32
MTLFWRMEGAEASFGCARNQLLCKSRPSQGSRPRQRFYFCARSLAHPFNVRPICGHFLQPHHIFLTTF